MTPINPFEPRAFLDGTRRWVEIETPTEAPEQVNALAAWVADVLRGLPATIQRTQGSGNGHRVVARSVCGRDASGILVLSHPGTAHPPGFLDRLDHTLR
jgi:glutamate carboxypeptidase